MGKNKTRPRRNDEESTGGNGNGNEDKDCLLSHFSCPPVPSCFVWSWLSHTRIVCPSLLVPSSCPPVLCGYG
ncbi:hypothetical protein DVH24_002232 [Malus domestica]|uniref:Uncharacterized protein n=1 Tax=Malus domestica TaxID=3750 RepID=A0A498I954_MALDO|nr:hypothetical protein DVH24_002232 [Malus domestica]